MRLTHFNLALLTALTLNGCGILGNPDATKPAPLDTAFTRSSSADVRRGPSDDRSGVINYDAVRPDPTDAKRPPAPNQPSVESTGVSDVVNRVVSAPSVAAPATSSAITQRDPSTPANAPVPQSPTQATYLQLGSVVVEVNGTPIFANKVVDTIAPVLSARARQLNETQFKRAAAEEIARQLESMIKSELEYAAAERSLDANDKRYAEALTSRWRDDQIRRFGGSLQLARQGAAAQGLDFDEIVKDRSKIEMVRVYYSKKVLPRVQISADDMREYYSHHKNDQFSEHEGAKFRVIKISISKSGGEDAAKTKIDGIRQRVAGGEDFAAIAGTMNDDDYLARTHGDVSGSDQWIDKGAFAVTAVDDAVWKLSPGQVTDVVRSGDAFYLARLEQEKAGRVRRFDDEDVQTQIRDTLQAEQLNAFRDSKREQLMKDAIVTPNPPLIGPAIEMAIQKYPAWSGQK